jgi:hypothetical protein
MKAKNEKLQFLKLNLLFMEAAAILGLGVRALILTLM